MKTAVFRFVLLLALPLAGCSALDRWLGDTRLTDGPATGPDPEVPYFPSTDEAVLGMLTLAGTGPSDVVYDLGCGDGRIVIAAAKEFGARGVGVEIDPAPLRMAVYEAKRAGVEDRVRFVSRGPVRGRHRRRHGCDALPVRGAQPQAAAEAAEGPETRDADRRPPLRFRRGMAAGEDGPGGREHAVPVDGARALGREVLAEEAEER